MTQQDVATTAIRVLLGITALVTLTASVVLAWNYPGAAALGDKIVILNLSCVALFTARHLAGTR